MFKKITGFKGFVWLLFFSDTIYMKYKSREGMKRLIFLSLCLFVVTDAMPAATARAGRHVVAEYADEFTVGVQ